ncbi:MAG: hypothetical protein M0D57_18505 [Sphingobacteriales bacterium JAD_PAG50586_3]|nr:MAG: hypothetical protein M0D57_18505 [Sphingobacteriales bacterium JAD_PAG50586_3]
MKPYLKTILILIIIVVLTCCKQVNPVECVNLCFEIQPKEILPLEDKIAGRNPQFTFHLGKEFYPLSYSSDFADSIIKHDKKANIDAIFYLPIVDDKKQSAIITPYCISLINEEYVRYKKFVLDNVDSDYISNGNSSHLSGEPVILYYSDSRIGVGYYFHQYTSGAVHGCGFYRTINVNLTTNTPINFNNYFKVTTTKDTTNFLTTFNRKLRLIDCQLTGLEEEGLNFIIRKDSIDFLFSAYEVGSYVQGTPALTLSKSELKNFIEE